MLRRNLHRELPGKVYLDLGPEMVFRDQGTSQPEAEELRGHVSEGSDHRHPSFVSFIKRSVP